MALRVGITAAAMLAVEVAALHPTLHASPTLHPTLPLRPLQPLARRPTIVASYSAAVVCPAAGVVLSNLLYAAPLPAVISSVRKGSLGAFNPLPTTLMVLGTASWLGYGLSARNPWIVATNVPGAVAAWFSFVSMLPLMRSGKALVQVKATILAGLATSLCLWCALIFGGAAAAVRSYWLGIYATAICIALFASPLTTMATVLRTRNSASILAPLAAAQLANCAMWTTYGVLSAHDVFVWGPNGAGLLLGLAQLGLKLAFPSKDGEASD